MVRLAANLILALWLITEVQGVRNTVRLVGEHQEQDPRRAAGPAEAPRPAAGAVAAGLPLPGGLDDIWHAEVSAIERVTHSLGEARVYISATASGSALRVRHGVSSLLEDSPSWLRPDYLLLLAFFVLFGVTSFKIYMQTGAAAEQSARVRARRDSLQGTYMESVQEVEGILQGMSESSAYLAEWNFEEKRRGLEKIMMRLRDRPERFVGDEQTAGALVDPFREFLTQWLHVFQQCSLDPVDKPKVMVADKELNKARTFVDLVGLVADRLGKHHMSFIQNWIKKVGRVDAEMKPPDAQSGWFETSRRGDLGWGISGQKPPITKKPDHVEESDEDIIHSDSDLPEHHVGHHALGYPIECKFRVFKVTVLSQTHFLLIFCFLLGLLAFLVQFLVGHWNNAFLVVVAEGIQVVLLVYIQELDEVSRLQHEIHQLELLSKEVHKHHAQLTEFYGKLRKLGQLWRHRTLPCLEQFEMLNNRLDELPGPDKVGYLKEIGRSLRAVESGLGDVDMWMGNHALDEDYLKMACKQLNDATEFIERNPRDANAGAMIVKRVDNMFGFLVVRVLACFKLANKGKLGQMSNPYVTVTKGRKGKEQWQTKIVHGSLDPVFGEEFFMPVAWNDTMVELHVWDDQIGEDPSLGLVEVNFRDFQHGAWHKKRTKLVSAKKGKAKDSDIMYEIFFASQIRQLALLTQEQGGHAGATSSSRP